MTGPYAQIPQGYGRLYGWIQQRGLQPAGMPAAVYLTAPAEVPEADARWELWAPLAGNPAEEGAEVGGISIKHVPEMLVATTMHRGPYDTMAATYEALWEFVAAEGYEVAGPPMERYHSDPNTTPPEEYLTEVIVPLKKA
jgi:effector-binding domain-containing protein